MATVGPISTSPTISVDNNLYRNRGGRFRDEAAKAGVEDMGPGMSASWFDYDGEAGRISMSPICGPLPASESYKILRLSRRVGQRGRLQATHQGKFALSQPGRRNF